MVFKFGYDSALIDKPIRYGQSFKKPSKATVRKHRNSKRAKNGKRMFEARELCAILKAAKQPLRAMILLGINCGFGQSDLASLPLSALNLDEGWVDYPRPKTGVERRCPLWNETIRAASEVATNRPTPKNDTDSNLLFLTKYGHRWVRTNPNGKGTPDDAVGKEFTKLLLKLKRLGVSFYALRHTFETIGGKSLDQVAVDHIMGHARDDMASKYREDIGDERLIKVTDEIHDWLFKLPESEDG
jgi:integrase